MISTLLTALLSLFVFAALTDLVLLARRSTLGGALAPAFACFVALESVILNGLSVFSAVNHFWLLAVHFVLLGLWFCHALFHGRLLPLIQRYRLLFQRLSRTRSVQVLFPLLILLTMTAVLYPPNTYDVLTYHMARVVHWMQNGSVAYYPTAIDRQNVMGPGAEYLLLLFQVLSFSDKLANLLQLSAFVILVISTLHILRLFKTKGGLAGWIMILAVTAPIAIMEASGAKNDLVAAVMAIAVILSCIRFLIGHTNNIRLGEYGLAGICLASAFLVKPTALLAALPILATGICVQLPRILTKYGLKRFFVGMLLLTVTVIIVAGPDILRKQSGAVSRHEVYPLFSEYTVDRLWNPLRHFAHNTPFPDRTAVIARKFGYHGNLITKDIFNPHEDMVGNPFQASALVITAGMSLLVWFALFCRLNHLYMLLLSLSPIVSWLVFGMVIKDQAWITRLQLPLFYLLPFSFIYLNCIVEKKKLFALLLKVGVCFVALFSLAYAMLVATHVLPRPLALSHFWGERPSRTGAYYSNAQSLKADHGVFFQSVAKSGCKRIGLVFGPDSVDYPLTWRAMQSGVQVRYLREQVREGNHFVWRFREEDADWPCMIYASYGVPEHVPDRGRQYLSAGDYHTYLRNLKWEFEQSSQVCFLLTPSEFRKKTNLLNEAEIEFDKQGIRIVSQGNDPQLLLPVFPIGSARSAIMKVIIESSADTEVQLYYMTRELPYYTEQNSIHVKSKQGKNELYFFLPVDDIVGAIRLDPGRQPGAYVLNEIEIRTVNKSLFISDKSVK